MPPPPNPLAGDGDPVVGKKAASDTFEFAISLHFGPLRGEYNAEADRFEYTGLGILPAALAVDAVNRREVGATDAFHGTCDIPVRGCHTVPRRTDDDNHIYIIAHDGNVDKRQTRSADEASVAGAVSAKVGAIVRKRIAVLAMELIPPSGWDPKRVRESPLPNYGQVADTIRRMTKEHHGEIASIHDTKVILVFNALASVASPARQAYRADEAIRRALEDRRMVSTIAFGWAHVAPMAGGVLVIGDAPRRARNVLHELVTRCEKEKALERTAVVDAVTASEIHISCELQCIGALLPESKTAFHFFVERQWEGEEEMDDDEWLGRLQRLEAKSVYAPLNNAFDAMRSGKREPAVMLLKEISTHAEFAWSAFSLQQLIDLVDASKDGLSMSLASMRNSGYAQNSALSNNRSNSAFRANSAPSISQDVV